MDRVLLPLLVASVVCSCDPCDDKSVFRGDAFVRSNEQAEQLAGIQCVTGDLSIGAERFETGPGGEPELDVAGNDVSDLSPLSELRFVEGTLFIEGASRLESLTGLEGLVYVGRPLRVVEDGVRRGDLFISLNFRLNSLEELESLEHVGGDLFVTENSAVPVASVQELIRRVRVHGPGGITIFGNGDALPTIGELCPGNSCEEGSSCVVSGPDQRCRADCDVQLTDPCGDGFACRALEDDGGACMPAGRDQEPCPCDEGFGCTNVEEASPVCLPLCDPAEPLGCDAGRECAPFTGQTQGVCLP